VEPKVSKCSGEHSRLRVKSEGGRRHRDYVTTMRTKGKEFIVLILRERKGVISA